MIDELMQPLLSGGIRHVNFFNGRVLFAEDLQAEQSANRKIHRYLGEAIGEGVVRGLDVSVGTAGGSMPTVRVTPGLAVNRSGHVLALPAEKSYYEIALVRDKPLDEFGTGLFAECLPVESAPVPTGNAAFILTIAPASGLEESVPSVNLEDNGRAAGCGKKFLTRGIRFRLVHLDVTNTALAPGSIGHQLRSLLTTTDEAGLSLFRNLLAHLCLGTNNVAELAANLYGGIRAPDTVSQYGPLDALRDSNRLTRCDVPLALIFWTTAGIRFVDLWPVRRSVHSRPESSRPPFPATSRHRAEAEAALLQFQQHLEHVIRPGIPTGTVLAIQANEYYRFLPAAGVIPVSVNNSRAIQPQSFFRDLTVREPVFINAAQVRALFDESFRYPPIDLTSRELIWLYAVRENREESGSPKIPYLIFTTGHMPFAGEAQYDVARWDFSNYSHGVADKPVRD